jgi:hypothetical protein
MSAPGADLSLPLHGSDMEMMEQISHDLVGGFLFVSALTIMGPATPALLDGDDGASLLPGLLRSRRYMFGNLPHT